MQMFRRERQSCSKCKTKRRAVKGQGADLPRAEVAAWHFFIDAVGFSHFFFFLITMPEHGRKPKEGLGVIRLHYSRKGMACSLKDLVTLHLLPGSWESSPSGEQKATKEQ